MKFRNVKSNEIVEVTKKVFIDAYSHNSNWEKVEEKAKVENPNDGKGNKEMTVADIQKKLTEMNVQFNKTAKKEELLVLLKEAEEKAKGENPNDGKGDDNGEV